MLAKDKGYGCQTSTDSDVNTKAEATVKTLKASNTGWTPADYQRARAVMPKVLAFGAMLYQAGVPMMIGTEGVGGGPYYARELVLHQQAGIPVWAILRMRLRARRTFLASATALDVSSRGLKPTGSF